MSKDKKRMIHMQVSDTNRAVLKLLKKKFDLAKMDDVLTLLLQQYDKDIFEKGNRIAEIQREVEHLIDAEDDE